jgi:hypothetical protein
MADAKKYAEWILANQDKKGTPEFEIVSKAYKQARQMSAVSEPRASDSTSQEATPSAQDITPPVVPEGFAKALEEAAVQDIPEERRIPESAAMLAPPGFPTESLAGGFGYQITPRQEQQMRETASYIPVAAAAMLTSPGTVPAVAVPAAAEVFGSLIRGDSGADTARNAMIAALTPGFKAKESASFLRSAATAIGQDAAQMVLAIFSGETAKGFIEGKSFSESAKDALKLNNYYLPAGLAPISGSLRGFSNRASFLKNRADEARQDLSALLGDDIYISPAMADPETFAQIERQIIQNNPNSKYAQNARYLGESVNERWAKLFPKAPAGPDIARKLEPYMQKAKDYRAQKEALARTQEVYELKKNQLVAMERGGASPDEIAKMRGEVLSAEMATINQKARDTFFNANPSALNPSGLAPSTVQQRFTDTVDEVFRVRGQQADELYKASGVPFDQPFIPASELISAVRSATRAESGLYVNGIIKAIEKEGGDTGMLTVNQMKQLRSNFGAEFNSNDQTAIDAFDRISNLAYGAVTKRTSNIIGKQFGQEAKKAISEVNAWWGRTANLANSKTLRGVFSGETRENLAEMLAKRAASGELRTFQKYAEFIKEVGSYAPDVGELGKRAMVDTLREGFFASAVDASGRVNVNKLYTNLNKAAQFRELNSVLPISQLGFGDAKQIKQIESTFRANGLKNVTPEELDEFYANPLVRSAIEGGQDIKKVASPAAVRIVFDRRINQTLARQAAGAPVGSAEYKRLVNEAEAAGITVEQLKERISKLSRENPIVQFFENPGTQVGQTLSPNAVRDITGYLIGMDNTARGQFIKALRNGNKKILRSVQSRVTSDILGNTVKASMDAATPYTLDIRAVQKIYNEGINDAQNKIYLLKQVMEPGEFERFKSKLPSLARIVQWAQGGPNGNLSFDSRNILGAAASKGMFGGASGQVVVPPNVFRSIIGEVFDTAKGIRFRTAAAILEDSDIAAFILSGGKYALPVQKQILINSDKELMDEGMVPPLDINKQKP